MLIMSATYTVQDDALFSDTVCSDNEIHISSVHPAMNLHIDH